MDATALKRHIAHTIRSRREQLGLSQTELGMRVELSETTISRIEREEYLPTLEKMYYLAHALDIHPVTLLQGDDLTKFVAGLSKESRLGLRAALEKLLHGTKTKG
jgi:transcriptional regulator with XRE-family HTH domain